MIAKLNSYIKTKNSALVFLLLIMAVFLLGFGSKGAVKEQHMVKVSIALNKSSISIKFNGRYKLVSVDSKKFLLSVTPSGEPVNIRAESSGILFGKKLLKHNAIHLVNLTSNTITLEGRKFSGDIFIYLTAKTKLIVVNRLNVEEYLRGVVPCEMSKGTSLEALKAQAVAARTYAYNKILRPQTNLYDLFSDTSSQVYEGVTKYSETTDRAVRQTADVVMFYKGRLFPSFYHSMCGGVTRKAENVWKINEQVPGNVSCAYCMKKARLMANQTKSKNFRSGHGVGMCQHGAIDMAKKGCSYKHILRYYYPSVRFREI